MGFEGSDEAARTTIEVFESDDQPCDPSEVVRAVLPRLVQERTEEMKAWPTVTDCDRLDEAFEELNAMGIMARHDWTCCGNCGVAGIDEEFGRLGGVQDGKPLVGYFFYHQQDTESAVDGGALFMNYGTTQRWATQVEADEASINIGQIACATIAKHGLKVDWDGSINRRLCVSLDWKRRARPARFCEDAAGGLKPASSNDAEPRQSWWRRLWPWGT